MIASNDAVFRYNGAKISVETGTLYVTESFYYVHSDNSVEVEQAATVVLLKDMVVNGKFNLSGTVVSNGFHVVSSDSQGAPDARVYVDRAGVDMSAFPLGDNIRNVQDGVSTGPVALKWDVDDTKDRWINAVGDLTLDLYSAYQDPDTGGYVYMYECLGLDSKGDFQINLYQNQTDEAPMELPDDDSIGTGAFGWILVTFNQKYKGETYYLEIEQHGVRSARAAITVGDGITP